MTKKSNTKPKAKQRSTEALNVLEKTNNLLDQGVVHALIIGINDKGKMMMDSTLNSYEELHAALNRATLELTMAHIRFINEQSEGGQDGV